MQGQFLGVQRLYLALNSPREDDSLTPDGVMSYILDPIKENVSIPFVIIRTFCNVSFFCEYTCFLSEGFSSQFLQITMMNPERVIFYQWVIEK